MTNRALLEELIEAHGGRNRWQRVALIEATLSSGGFAFAAHCQPFALRDLRIAVNPHGRNVVLQDFCRPGWRGLWTPDHVQIRDDNDKRVAERHDPRAQFGRLVKQVRWDKLDILYFGGYALWNYLSFPFILETPGVSVSGAELAPSEASSSLTAHFDATVPTHSPTQVFHLDESLRLVRHDYTADVIGAWATAANLCLGSEQVAGFRFYTRRKVYPRMGPKQTVMPFPTLVWIEIDDLAVRFVEPVAAETLTPGTSSNVPAS
jgi:hypothetical protein